MLEVISYKEVLMKKSYKELADQLLRVMKDERARIGTNELAADVLAEEILCSTIPGEDGNLSDEEYIENLCGLIAENRAGMNREILYEYIDDEIDKNIYELSKDDLIYMISKKTGVK